jgi:hypothetical protein
MQSRRQREIQTAIRLPWTVKDTHMREASRFSTGATPDLAAEKERAAQRRFSAIDIDFLQGWLGFEIADSVEFAGWLQILNYIREGWRIPRHITTRDEFC